MDEISCIVLIICATVTACIFIIMFFKKRIVDSNNRSKEELLQKNIDHQKKMKELEYKHKEEIEKLKLE